jgi:FkbM family methyltransferase
MRPRSLRARIARRALKLRRQRELARVASLPARTPGTTEVAGPQLVFIDGPSFLSAYRAIFEQHIYRFESTDAAPSIIDCGANIGLGVVYWKLLFPGCRVTAFEPDATAYEALVANCEGFSGVEHHNAAVWVSEGEQGFVPDGADSGRLSTDGDDPTGTVPTIRLRDRLSGHVDLLKLDIEGAEVAVLEDCADRLDDIEHLFVEYHGFAARRQDLDVLLRILTGAGFRWHIHTEYGAPTPFVRTPVDGGMDQRLNIFAFRRPHEVA